MPDTTIIDIEAKIMPGKEDARYRMPAEWDSHFSTWLAWPHRRSDWPGKFSTIRWVYGEIARVLTRFERIQLIVRSEEEGIRALHYLTQSGADRSKVNLVIAPTDRSWVRDSGPTFVFDVNNHRTLLDWHFNAWAKYPNWSHDDAIPKVVAQSLDLPMCEIWANEKRVVLEGGSIDVNGQGLLLTTEECLLSKIQQRNPSFEQKDYEELFERYLGVKKVLWLGEGIAGDDTHGHVDDLARFVGPRTIVTVVEKKPSDPNFRPTQENLDRLKGMTDLAGQPLEIVSLPMPAPVVFDGTRLPASYANFYIANDVVLVPTFNDPQDRTAIGILGELFPNREVVGIHSCDLVWGLGTLHCMTQQEPANQVKIW